MSFHHPLWVFIILYDLWFCFLRITRYELTIARNTVKVVRYKLWEKSQNCGFISFNYIAILILYNAIMTLQLIYTSQFQEKVQIERSRNCERKSELCDKKVGINFLLFYFIQWWKWASIQNKNNNMVSIKSISSNGNPNKILLKPRFEISTSNLEHHLNIFF